MSCAGISYNNLTFGSTTEIAMHTQPNRTAYISFPVPILTIDQTVTRLSDGPISTRVVNFTLDGKIIDTSPVYCASYSGLLSQAERLRNVFSEDGLLSISGLGSGVIAVPNRPTVFPCKVQSINFKPTPDNWAMSIDYSIQLASEIPGPCSGSLVESASNSWQLNPVEEYFTINDNISGLEYTAMRAVPGLRINHSISAIGKYIPTGTGTNASCHSGAYNTKFQNARAWVADNFYTGAPEFLNGYTCYDFVRNIEKSVVEGSYSINDSFTIYVGSGVGAKSGFLDSFSINDDFDYEAGTRTVTVAGSVQGLENYGLAYTGITPTFPYGWGTGIITPPSAVLNTKFTNAVSGYRKYVEPFLYGRACYSLSGSSGTGYCGDYNSLNPIPKSTSIGYDLKGGSISYSYSYDNRPISLVPCALSENLVISDSLPAKQIAEIFVLGRNLGPVMQDLGTYSAPTRSVNYELTLPRASSISGAIPLVLYSQISGIIYGFDPALTITRGLPANVNNPPKVQSFIKENSETWDPKNGRFTKNLSWTYTLCYGTLTNLSNPSMIK